MALQRLEVEGSFLPMGTLEGGSSRARSRHLDTGESEIMHNVRETEVDDGTRLERESSPRKRGDLEVAPCNRQAV